MKKGGGKDRIVILDSYTRKQIAVYDNINKAAKELELSASSIRVGVYTKKPIYDCYWVYERNLDTFQPAVVYQRKTRGLNISEKLKQLIKQNQDTIPCGVPCSNVEPKCSTCIWNNRRNKSI